MAYIDELDLIDVASLRRVFSVIADDDMVKQYIAGQWEAARTGVISNKDAGILFEQYIKDHYSNWGLQYYKDKVQNFRALEDKIFGDFVFKGKVHNWPIDIKISTYKDLCGWVDVNTANNMVEGWIAAFSKDISKVRLVTVEFIRKCCIIHKITPATNPNDPTKQYYRYKDFEKYLNEGIPTNDVIIIK